MHGVVLAARRVTVLAKPSDKLPERTITINCAKCGSKLYKYHKNGKGSLVKCFHKRIAEDYTNQDLCCPSCGQEFARERTIRGEKANKIIGGKVEVKK